MSTAHSLLGDLGFSTLCRRIEARGQNKEPFESTAEQQAPQQPGAPWRLRREGIAPDPPGIPPTEAGAQVDGPRHGSHTPPHHARVGNVLTPMQTAAQRRGRENRTGWKQSQRTDSNCGDV